MGTLKTQAEAKEEHDRELALRKRAARQAAQALKAPETIPTVECTVLPLGDGKISMGEHIGGLGEAHYEDGEKFTVQLPIAVALYDKGFVNFPDARKASQDAKAARAKAAAEARAVRKAAEDEAAEG